MWILKERFAVVSGDARRYVESIYPLGNGVAIGWTSALKTAKRFMTRDIPDHIADNYRDIVVVRIKRAPVKHTPPRLTG